MGGDRATERNQLLTAVDAAAAKAWQSNYHLQGQRYHIPLTAPVKLVLALFASFLRPVPRFILQPQVVKLVFQSQFTRHSLVNWLWWPCDVKIAHLP